MIEMRMAKQNDGFAIVPGFHHRITKPAHAGAAIEDDAGLRCQDFNAGRITAIDYCVGAG